MEPVALGGFGPLRFIDPGDPAGSLFYHPPPSRFAFLPEFTNQKTFLRPPGSTRFSPGGCYTLVAGILLPRIMSDMETILVSSSKTVSLTV